MPSDDDGAFVFQRLGIGYFLLGFAPVFVLVDPQNTGEILLALVAGLIPGAIAFGGFVLLSSRLLSAVAGIDAAEVEPTTLAYYSTYLAIGVGALVLLPVVLWAMSTVAPVESSGGRRSPLGGALLVSAALAAVVAEPLWLRVLQFTPLDVVR